MVFMKNAISLTKSERIELTRRANARTGRAEDARRARLVLLLAQGRTWDDICDRLPCSRGFIDSWSKRFIAERVAGLYSRHRGQSASVLTPRLEARVLEWTLHRKPADGSTHWSTRKLAKALGVSHMMVSRVWTKHALKPHRVAGYLASNDPDFETKAADVIGLYSTAKIPYCLCRPGAPSGTASNTTDTVRCLFMPPSIPRPVRYWGRLRRVTPRRSSWHF